MNWRRGYRNDPRYFQRSFQSAFTGGQGTRDAQIRWVQYALNSIFRQNRPVDGVMHAATRTAVRNFQQRSGLPVTGFVGPDTQQALLAATTSAGGMGPDSGGDMTGAVDTGAGNPGGDMSSAAGGMVAGAGAQNPIAADADARELLEEYGLPLGEFETQSEFENWESGPSPGADFVTMSRSSPAFIRFLQQTLNRVLGLQLKVDGDAGPKTRSALRSFQAQRGLVANGKVDERTEAALLAAIAALPNPSGASIPKTQAQQQLTVPQFIQKALDLLKRQNQVGVVLGPFRTTRLQCLLTGLLDPSFDDRHVGFQTLWSYQRYITKDDQRWDLILQRVRDTFDFYCRHFQTDDKFILNALRVKDEDIWKGIQWMHQQYANLGDAVSPGMFIVKEWMADRQKRPNNVYSCYR